MIYLLDTNFCIELLNKHDSRAAKKLASGSPKDIRLCSVVFRGSSRALSWRI